MHTWKAKSTLRKIYMLIFEMLPMKKIDISVRINQYKL